MTFLGFSTPKVCSMAETYINKCKILGTAKKEYFKRIDMENLMHVFFITF